MDYIPPYVDMSTPNIAQDNLTPDLTRICPICFDKWSGQGAQLIYHILQDHPEYLIKLQDNYEGDLELDYNEYTFTLVENYSDDEKPLESNEIVKIFIEYEKIFVLSVKKFDGATGNRGFNVTVNYIGPYLNKIECMKFTCLLQYELNNKRCLRSICDVVGETTDFIIDDDLIELKRAISVWPVVIKIQISVPKRFQQLIDAMKSRVTCYKCLSMMRPPIRHCRYGHIICTLCRHKIESRPICPTCYRTSTEFNREKCRLSHEMHPAMYKQSISGYKAEILGGKGDDNINKLKADCEGGTFMCRTIGNLRLLEEEAMQVAYRCDVDKCNVWISYLDLEEHSKKSH